MIKIRHERMKRASKSGNLKISVVNIGCGARVYDSCKVDTYAHDAVLIAFEWD